jgi:hypothetical protein
MKKYLIERSIPDIGSMAPCELAGAAAKSNAAIAELFPAVQWVHSYVAGDRTFCIYLAESEETIRRHSEISGIPFDRISEIDKAIDPTTAAI